MIPKMQTPSSGNSLNSSRKSDFSTYYNNKSFLQAPSKESLKPKKSKRSPETCSIESGSQRAHTPLQQPSLDDVTQPPQDLASQISLPGYYRCGHVKPIECLGCISKTENSNKTSPKKGLEKMQQKAEELTKVVFARSKCEEELKEKLTDTTEDTRLAIIRVFEEQQKKLVEMKDRLLGNLESTKATFLESVKFDQSVKVAQKHIGVLEGDFTTIDELKPAFDESDDIKNKVLEENLVIQDLGDSLLQRANTKAFTEDLERVLKINQKAYDALLFPEFVEPERYSLMSKYAASTMASSQEWSFHLSFGSEKPANF